MRFKLILLVNSETYGNTIPVSYQYELSSCIYRKLAENADLYSDWLQKNGFLQEINSKYRLFSISNFYIPKIKVEVDRLHILAKHVQLWISFLPERGTEEFVNQLFSDQIFTIGDRLTQVELHIKEIIRCSDNEDYECADYLSLSPIVFTNVRQNKSVEYIGPDSPSYKDIFFRSLLDKYQYFYGKEVPYESYFDLQILNEPKRKGIFIKRFTREETKVIGYMYKFRLTVHPQLQQLVYNTGIGDKISLGFGCVEILK